MNSMNQYIKPKIIDKEHDNRVDDMPVGSKEDPDINPKKELTMVN